MMHIISLGAGVQSSTMALMAAAGEITPMPDCAIFADTQAEPKSVYTWLDWLEKQLPFPVHRVTKGSLEEDDLKIRVSSKSGKRYMKGSIPAFVLNPDRSTGLLGRKCTEDYKIVPLQRKVRELVGIKRAGAGIIRAKMWIGISRDEAHRMKPARVDYIENTWPLLDLRMTRDDCYKWMSSHGFAEPPRSACRFCPFHSDAEWIRLRDKEPEEWTQIVAFERRMHQAQKDQEHLKGVPFLHRSTLPIDQVVFKTLPANQQLNMFGNECEGMCGV